MCVFVSFLMASHSKCSIQFIAFPFEQLENLNLHTLFNSLRDSIFSGWFIRPWVLCMYVCDLCCTGIQTQTHRTQTEFNAIFLSTHTMWYCNDFKISIFSFLLLFCWRLESGTENPCWYRVDKRKINVYCVVYCVHNSTMRAVFMCFICFDCCRRHNNCRKKINPMSADSYFMRFQFLWRHIIFAKAQMKAIKSNSELDEWNRPKTHRTERVIEWQIVALWVYKREKCANLRKKGENKSQEFYCSFWIAGNTWHISGSYKLIKPVSHHFRSTSMTKYADKYFG